MSTFADCVSSAWWKVYNFSWLNLTCHRWLFDDSQHVQGFPTSSLCDSVATPTCGTRRPSARLLLSLLSLIGGWPPACVRVKTDGWAGGEGGTSVLIEWAALTRPTLECLSLSALAARNSLGVCGGRTQVHQCVCERHYSENIKVSPSCLSIFYK